MLFMLVHTTFLYNFSIYAQITFHLSQLKRLELLERNKESQLNPTLSNFREKGTWSILNLVPYLQNSIQGVYILWFDLRSAVTIF